MTLAEQRIALFDALNAEAREREREARRELLGEALRLAGGNQKRAAELLGLSSRHIARWLDEDPSLRASLPSRSEVIKAGLAARAKKEDK